MDPSNPLLPRKKIKKDHPKSNAKLSIQTQPPDYLICPICMEFYLGHSIFQCNEGHVLCVTCFIRLDVPRKCPSCRIPMGEIRNRVLEEIAGKYPVQCKWRYCKHIGPAQNFWSHKCYCEHRHGQCVLKDCGWEGYGDELETHLKEKHNALTKTITDESSKGTWGLGDEMTKSGCYGVKHKEKSYFITWDTSDGVGDANVVHFYVMPFRWEEKTNFILGVVDEKTEYILKANTYVEESIHNIDTYSSSLSIPKFGSKERYLTIEFC